MPPVEYVAPPVEAAGSDVPFDRGYGADAPIGEPELKGPLDMAPPVDIMLPVRVAASVLELVRVNG